MKKIFLQIFAICLSFLYLSETQAQNCKATPNCASLGYQHKKEECDTGAVKCISGNGYYCKTSHKQCVIGDIYYSDGSCSSALVQSKNALGIVVNVTSDGKHGQIMAPKDIGSDGSVVTNKAFLWSNNGMEISGLTKYPDEIYAALDFDSCGNTNKIVSSGNADQFPAAWGTRKYAPTAETKGKWCLPAAGVLNNMINNKAVLDTAFKKLNGKPLSCYVFSSSLGSGDRYWAYCNTSFAIRHQSDSAVIRPVLEF